MRGCEFCEIVANQGDEILEQDAEFIVVRDIKPDFEHHFQVIPKVHIESVGALVAADTELVERMHTFGVNFMNKTVGTSIESRYGFHQPQSTSVDHLHMHCIAETIERLKKGIRLDAPVVHVQERNEIEIGCERKIEKKTIKQD